MELPEFIISRDVIYALFGYGAVLSLVSIWVAFSGQDLVPKDAITIAKIAIRLALLAGLLFAICWWAGVAIWIVPLLAIVLVSVGIIVDVPFSGMLGFASFYLIQKVLGIPARHEWMRRGQLANNNTSQKSATLQDLIDKQGWTVGALRPIGEVRVEGATYEATSMNGNFVSEHTPISVVAVRAGRLVVRVEEASS